MSKEGILGGKGGISYRDLPPCKVKKIVIISGRVPRQDSESRSCL